MKLPTRCEKLLIIPDAHAHPKYDNDRFDLLAKLCAAEKPDTIVCLGDVADMPSLSSYDKGRRSFEGRRYKLDIEVTRDAMRRLHAGTRHAARRIMLLGNHEQRILKATNLHPELDGTIGIEDLGFERYGWEVIPYEETAVIAGWSMAHHFASGVGGRPICQATKLNKLLHQSAIVGHSHLLDIAEESRPDGTKLTGIIAGCYSHPRMVESWNRASAHMYWNGVIILEDVRDGTYGEMRCVKQDRMRKVYA